MSKRELRIRWCPVLDEYARVLSELGHDVERRPVIVGEDLSKYDVVWAALMSPTSFASNWVPGVLWAMSQAIDRKTGIVLYPDDWHVPDIAKGFERISVKGTHQLLKKWPTTGGPFYAGLTDATDCQVEKMIDASGQFGDASSRLWQRAVLGLSLFDGWGDPYKLLDSLKIRPVCVETFDVSPVFLERYVPEAPPPHAIRDRRWMLAGLSEHHESWAKKQGITWPLDSFGPAKTALRALEDEIEVMQEYSSRWGALVPKYPHSGSGWFRPRWITAALAGTPVLADPLDQEAIGGPYRVSTPLFESLTDTELERLSKAQWEWLQQHISRDMTKLRASLDHTVYLAAAR